MSLTSTETPWIVRLLLEDGVIGEAAEERVRKLLHTATSNLERALVEAELASAEDIARVYAKALGIAWVTLQEQVPTTDSNVRIPPNVIECGPGDGEGVLIGSVDDLVHASAQVAIKVTESVCRRHSVVILGFESDSALLGMIDPSKLDAVNEVSARCGVPVHPVAATPAVISEFMSRHFGERDEVREIASEDDAGGKHTDDEDDEEAAVILDLQKPIPAGKDSQVVRIVNILLLRSIQEGASDIHIEPYEDRVRVRYRIDGRLIETTPPPRSLFIPTISRLKILSKMDIAEKRVPQDGSIALRSGEHRVDLRVNTVPTVYGEKMVIRLLEKKGIPDRLQKLGFSDEQSGAFLKAAHSPNGLMFVTGPTGSGKSTTLYCCLNLINSPDENIVTVEDPVEYKFDGLNQVHVRANVGLTFATALRSFLRQDPDKIMVGEVRDQETAQICMRAALTGHLVLSTLHTNDSLQVVNRLVDMGIEPFLLGPALKLLEAQRLASRLCPECKEQYEIPEEVALRHGLEPGMTLFRKCRLENNTCEYCRGNGSKGRVGIYEVVPITQDIGEMIASSVPLNEVRAHVRNSGINLLPESAREKLAEGTVGLEDVAEYVKAQT